MTTPVFRFAPSPNGYLHLGHALSALLNFEMARAAGGRLILRIEDIDQARCRPDYERAIYEDLAWLGIEFEQPARRQSAHFDDYRAGLARLEALGLIYPSFESRGEIARLVAEREAPWPCDPDGAPLYPGAARSLSDGEWRRRMAAGEPYALRLDVAAATKRLPAKARPGLDPGWTSGSPQKTRQHNDKPAPSGPLTWCETGAGPAEETGRVAANPLIWGDVVLARKETPTSYHLSVAIDDAHQGVTHVVRGQDLFWATAVHRLLQEVLGLPEPRYHHHRLVLDAGGQKLSKSTRATALRALREDGAGPADIRRMVGL